MGSRALATLVAALALTASLAGCVGGDEIDLNAANAVRASVTPASGDVDTTFTFDASKTPGADDLTFTWDFGDGTNATGAVVEHTFAYDNALYEVRVTATQGNQSATGVLEVPVGSGENADPTVDVHAGSRWVGHGDVLTLNASANDPDGDPLEIHWLLAKDQGASDGHDHDHGGGGGGTYGIPEDTGKRGETTEFTFEESGTYRIYAQAVDPKGGSSETYHQVKVTQSVPKTTFDFSKEDTIYAGSGGAGASLALYGATQPSQNTYVDSARYDLRLIYPGSGTVGLDWTNNTAPADLDLVLVDGNGEAVAELNELSPTEGNASQEVDLKAGSYTLEVYANAGANIDYKVYLSLDLKIPGLTLDSGDGHDHEH